MRKIIFLYRQEKEMGEYFILTMPKIMLEAHGIDCQEKLISNIDLNTIKNSIVYVCKHINKEEAEILHKNNNLIYLDMVDRLAHLPHGAQTSLINFFLTDCKIDKIIFRQKYIADHYGNLGYYIPHHYDFRLDFMNVPDNNFLKNKISFPYTDPGGIFLHLDFPELFDVVPINTGMVFDYRQIKSLNLKCVENNFYFGLRQSTSTDYWYKPCTKTAAAAALNRNIIVNTDKALDDMLPRDYPYFLLDDSKEAFIEFYNSKIKIPNKSEYNYGLECMKNVKEKTNIFNQFELYNDLFTI
jgi:hypothetical protein